MPLPDVDGECVAPVDGVLDVDVPAVWLTVTATVNGAPLLGTPEDGLLQFETRVGERAFLGAVSEGIFEVLLAPGVFDLTYQGTYRVPGMPRNSRLVLGEGYRIAGDRGLAFDVPAAPATVALVVEGATGGVGTIKGFGPGGDFFTLVDSGQQATTWLAPGSYEIRYEEKQEGPGTPDNVGATLAKAAELTAPGPHRFVVEGVGLSGAIDVGGEEGNGFLYLLGDGLGSVALGSTNAGSYAVTVLPGTYRVRYQKEGGQGAIPQNSRADLPISFTVTQEGEVDLVATPEWIVGEVTVGGVSWAGSSETANLVLRSRKGDSVVLGRTNVGHLEALMFIDPTDVYDLYYEYVSGVEIPRNQRALLARAVTVDPDVPLVIDVPRARVSASVTANGQAVSAPAEISVTTGGDRAVLGTLTPAPLSAWVLPGSYAVTYSSKGGSQLAPANTNAQVAGPFTVEGATQVVVDVPMVEVGGLFTLGGSPNGPPSGTLTARRGGDQAQLAPAQGFYTARVIPGTYDLYYDRSLGGGLAPENKNHPLGCAELVGP